MNKSQELVALTRDIIAAIRQFEGLLHEEADVLASAEKDGLMEIADRKTRYADHLDQLVKRRARAMEGLGLQEGDPRQLLQLLESHDQVRVMTRDWDNALLTLKHCKQLNEIAGASIRSLTLYTRRGLEIITGAEHHPTYGPQGHFVDEAPGKERGTA